MSLVIDRDAPYRRAPELDLTLESDGGVTIVLDGMPHRLGPETLKILDAFTFAAPLGTTIAALGQQQLGTTGVDDLFATVRTLIQRGALLPSIRPAQSARPFPFGLYDSPSVQIRILNDVQRRSAYLAAVHARVRPGMTVVDLGTGSGILAVAAARAGARHVYAIEPSGMATYAKRVFEANGVADRITLVEGWSQRVALPERCHVLTHDLVGSEPLEMSVLEVLADARSRFLLDGGIVLPERVQFSLVAAELPAGLRQLYSYTEEAVTAWALAYDIDFTPLLTSRPTHWIGAYIPPQDAACLRPLSSATGLWTVQFGTPIDSRQWAVEIPIHSPASHVGLYGVTTIALTEDIAFVTDPHTAGPAPHWVTPLWLPEHSFGGVSCGDLLKVTYEYCGRGRSSVRCHHIPTTPCAPS